MKLKLDGVAETLFITLYIRAKDAMSDKPILNDKLSLEIMKKIDYDFDKFNSSKGSYFGTLARIRVMDREAKKFIEEHPNCTVVSVGCGLDTRFERIDNGKIKWYNLDFPEVIEARKNLLQPNDRVVDIPKSALDSRWTTEIAKSEEPILIISEGVLMYFSEEEVKQFLEILTDSFEEFEAQFDFSHTFLLNKGKKHDTVKHMNAEFRYGIVDGSEILKLNPKLKQTACINFTDELSTFKLGVFRLALPLFRKVNNRLCKYVYSNKQEKEMI